ncbi:hypothetical protein K439DRAFT_1616913 [Ramaria rubella]|nr:hypothetical protein K439DRAFT_1616913 [Ramaria rubella]
MDGVHMVTMSGLMKSTRKTRAAVLHHIMMAEKATWNEILTVIGGIDVPHMNSARQAGHVYFECKAWLYSDVVHFDCLGRGGVSGMVPSVMYDNMDMILPSVFLLPQSNKQRRETSPGPQADKRLNARYSLHHPADLPTPLLLIVLLHQLGQLPSQSA